MSWIIKETLRNSTWIKSRALSETEEFFSVSPDNDRYVEWINDVTYEMAPIDALFLSEGDEDIELSEGFSSYTQDFLDDDYLSLNEILDTIEELHESEHLSDFSMQIINLVMDGYSYRDISRITGVSHSTIKTKFQKICELISFYLGGRYTTEGFKQYIIDKYSLDEEHSKKLEEIIG